MTRVEWTRREPGEIEHLIAIMLCRENPSAIRIRPSRGDGGIDILVPHDNPRTVTVYQVKSFSENLTPKQKGKIERSFHRLCDFACQQGITVQAWYLTLPIDPTKENHLTWFQELTEATDFPCEWRALPYLEGLLSKYPEVVDYYLHDGRERLNNAIIELTNILRLQQRLNPDCALADSSTARQSPLESGDVREGLAALHQSLNRHDPHYYYDFSVDTSRPDIPEAPNLVAAVQEGDANQCVTFKIFARFNEAVVERPVPLSFSISVEPGSELEQDLQDFDRYGHPFEAPLGSTTITADLPGGLGGTLAGAGIKVGPAQAERGTYEIRLAVLDGAGVVLSEILMLMQPPTAGMTGHGLRLFGLEETGTFTLEILRDLQTGVSRFSLSRRDISGKIPAVVLPGVALLAECRPPHQFRVRQAYGPASTPPFPISNTAEHDEDARFILDLIEALDTIQQFTTQRVTIPDLSVFTRGAARQVMDVASLLCGDKLTLDWDELRVPLHPENSISDQDVFQAVLREPLSIVLNGEQIDLGVKQTYLAAVRLDTTWHPDADDGSQVRFVPAGESPAVISLLRDATKMSD